MNENERKYGILWPSHNTNKENKMNRDVEYAESQYCLKTLCLSLIFSLFLFWEANADAKNLAILIGIDRLGNPSVESTMKKAPDYAEIRALCDRFRSGATNEFEVILYSGEDTALEPLQKSLKKLLDPKNCVSRDAVLLFITGGTYLRTQKENKNLLAVHDSKFADESSFLDLDELQNLLEKSNTPAALLMIDAVRSDGIKSSETPFETLKELQNGITIAHTRPQVSDIHLGIRNNMTNFACWLDEALKGYADENKNGSLAVDEIANYVFENLKAVPNTPNPIMKSGANVSPKDVFFPCERTIHDILDDIAGQIIIHCLQKNVTTLLLKDFYLQSSHGTLRGSRNAYLKYQQKRKVAMLCLDGLKRRIDPTAEEDSNILKLPVDQNNMDTPAKTAILRNSLFEIEKDYYQITCALSFEDANETASAAQKPDQNQNDQADSKLPTVTISKKMLIKATMETQIPDNPPEEFIPLKPIIEVKGKDNEFHPLTLTEKDGVFHALFNVGDVYRIALQRTHQNDPRFDRLAARVFVDGRSILPQAPPEVSSWNSSLSSANSGTMQASTLKGMPGSAKFLPPKNSQTGANQTPENDSASASPASEPVEAPCVPTDEALFFILDQIDPNTTEARHFFEGFFTKLGEQKYDEFVVSTPKNSEKKDEMGIITITIYQLDTPNVPSGNTRGIRNARTVEGELRDSKAKWEKTQKPGKLLQTISISYQSKPVTSTLKNVPQTRSRTNGRFRK